MYKIISGQQKGIGMHGYLAIGSFHAKSTWDVDLDISDFYNFWFIVCIHGVYEKNNFFNFFFLAVFFLQNFKNGQNYQILQCLPVQDPLLFSNKLG